MVESRRFPWSGDRDADGGSESDGPEVRLAIYDSPLAAPRVIGLRGQEFHQFVGDLAARTYSHSRERGGRIPYVVIREIVENLIHAYFEGAVISIFDDGNTIRIADQGPGIADRQKALLPGFSTATPQMRRFIKGVGSGLPVAKEQLAFLGGAIAVGPHPPDRPRRAPPRWPGLIRRRGDRCADASGGGPGGTCVRTRSGGRAGPG